MAMAVSGSHMRRLGTPWMGSLVLHRPPVIFPYTPSLGTKDYSLDSASLKIPAGKKLLKNGHWRLDWSTSKAHEG